MKRDKKGRFARKSTGGLLIVASIAGLAAFTIVQTGDRIVEDVLDDVKTIDIPMPLPTQDPIDQQMRQYENIIRNAVAAEQTLNESADSYYDALNEYGSQMDVIQALGLGNAYDRAAREMGVEQFESRTVTYAE